MQTGTTPARRTATEPASDRSAPPTGPCRTATRAPGGPPASAATSPLPTVGDTSARLAGVAA